MAKKLVTTPGPLIIKVPMKPYLVKFLIKRFGKYHKATKNSWIGLNVIDLLSKDYQKPVSSKLDSFFVFEVPENLCRNYGYFPKYSKFPALEKKVDKIFRDFMYQHLDVNLSSGLYSKKSEVMNCLRHFFMYYKISEDDKKLETAYRNYVRYRNELHRNQDKKNLLLKH